MKKILFFLLLSTFAFGQKVEEKILSSNNDINTISAIVYDKGLQVEFFRKAYADDKNKFIVKDEAAILEDEFLKYEISVSKTTGKLTEQNVKDLSKENLCPKNYKCSDYFESIKGIPTNIVIATKETDVGLYNMIMFSYYLQDKMVNFIVQYSTNADDYATFKKLEKVYTGFGKENVFISLKE